MILFAAVAAAPLPFGSTDPATIAFWCIVLGVGLLRARALLPVLELGRLRGAAAGELFDGRAEGAAAAAAQRGVARLGGARHILALAGAALLAGAAPLVAGAAIMFVRRKTRPISRLIEGLAHE